MGDKYARKYSITEWNAKYFYVTSQPIDWQRLEVQSRNGKGVDRETFIPYHLDRKTHCHKHPGENEPSPAKNEGWHPQASGIIR